MEKSLRIRLSEDLHRAAKVKAAKTGTPMAEICRRALRDWVNNTKDKKEASGENEMR